MKKLCILIVFAAVALSSADSVIEKTIKIVDGDKTTIRIIYSDSGKRYYTEKVFSAATNGVLSEAEMIAAVKFQAGL